MRALAFALLFISSAAASADPKDGRFTIIPVHYQPNISIFLLDTHTGKVWEYQPYKVGENKINTFTYVDRLDNTDQLIRFLAPAPKK